jgi:hypothetical protein
VSTYRDGVVADLAQVSSDYLTGLGGVVAGHPFTI